MAATDYKFEGWIGTDKSAADGNMVWQEFEPKAWEETDVDIKITHCGVCGSDIHTLRSGWVRSAAIIPSPDPPLTPPRSRRSPSQGPTDYPCCVGHEIVGRVVRLGSQAGGALALGDRVGVGAQSEACGRADCAACAAGDLQFCPRTVGTYNATHLNGGKAWGGYATHKRCPARLVVKIPDGLSSGAAAPMLCGGVTTYVPLRRHGAGPGKRVGILGLGGLGHMGVMWAKALGADHVVVISRKSNKKADALKMGADDFIATAEDPGWAKKHADSLDLIICTVGSSSVIIPANSGQIPKSQDQPAMRTIDTLR